MNSLFAAADPLQSYIRQLQVVDGWRRDLQHLPDPYAEWQHFVVMLGVRRILLNFSVRMEEGKPACRLLVLLQDETGWQGDVLETKASIRMAAVDATFGASSMRLTPDGYRIHLATPWIAGELLLEPLAPPLLVPGVRLDQNLRFHWVSVPRLVASGRVKVRGEVWVLDRAPAYHDHNWGRFSMAGDFAWEWGFVLPEAEADPWNAVFLRVSDRARHRCRVQGLAIWRDGILFSSFRDDEIRTATDGIWTPESDHLVPAALAHRLTSGGSMPRSLEMTAKRGADQVHLTVTSQPPSRLLIPNEKGVAMVSEAAATVRICGTVLGHAVAFNGIGMLEVVDGGPER